MGCTDVRKGILNTLLTTLWQSVQSCTDESQYMGRNCCYQSKFTDEITDGWGVSHPHNPASYTPGVKAMTSSCGMMFHKGWLWCDKSRVIDINRTSTPI